MESVTTMPRRGQGLTRADLAAFPDDGWRYELLDGMLLVSPSPSLAHQRAALNLAVLLHAACPDDLYVMVAPFDVTLADDTVFIPDLLVAPRADFTAKDLPGAPCSPSRSSPRAPGWSTATSRRPASRRPAAPRSGWSTRSSPGSPSGSSTMAATARSSTSRAGSRGRRPPRSR
ncbi:hypothetical protein GCM10023340_02740 [Nocardioides marinquilinus]|uniref:Putative restriction endonuclease domain-containing protein n=1 Tax=Nocardioides marinquilinus TaxID=1210400 RepID=A0ABP9P6E3_9ACTN